MSDKITEEQVKQARKDKEKLEQSIEEQDKLIKQFETQDKPPLDEVLRGHDKEGNPTFSINDERLQKVCEWKNELYQAAESLTYEYESCDDAISSAKVQFNEAVESYNEKIREFKTNLESVWVSDLLDETEQIEDEHVSEDMLTIINDLCGTIDGALCLNKVEQIDEEAYLDAPEADDQTTTASDLVVQLERMLEQMGKDGLKEADEDE